jgi:GT2 family glycosyltransferase
LLVVDDASGRQDLRRLIDHWDSHDERVRAFYLEQNAGIAGATNFGIEHAKGEFIGFLDHDDELTPDALTWMTYMLNENPGALWLYSDEDLMSTRGRCHSPHFKPDFSPEFLLSNMFTCHFSVYCAELLRRSGGLRSNLDGSQDHDLALRLSEVVPREKIVHIPRVLYHWRVIPGSTAMAVQAKPKAPAAGRQAVRDALARRKIKGRVTSHEVCETMYRIELEPGSAPQVSVIIATGKRLDAIRGCIDAARTHTAYPNYEIVVIRSNAGEAPCLGHVKDEQIGGRVRVLEYEHSFNDSDMNNIAAASVDSEFVVFMHDDVEVISGRWLEQLVAVAQLDDSIAAVGGLLLRPDRTVEHGGVILGCCDGVGYAHRNVHSCLPGYFGRLHALQEMSGIAGALVLIRRSSFQSVGGFNTGRYPAAYNDVDLCIRLRKNGFRCIYDPLVRSVHHERVEDLTSDGGVYRNRLVGEHAAMLKSDPFYNRNLGLDSEPFRGYRLFPIEEQIPFFAKTQEGCRN